MGEGVKPRLLDLFCGAGGCTKGYQNAGFYVVGVDIEPQPNYCGDEFHQGDALTLSDWIDEVDAIHASPPCQAHSTIGKQVRTRFEGVDHPDLVAATRDYLEETCLPYVIENVPGAPLRDAITLCGSSFGLNVRRHRLFETNFPIMAPPCAHYWQTPRFCSPDKRRGPEVLASVVAVYGHPHYAGHREVREEAMGIDWMSSQELTQAIPPAYTEHIGSYLMAEVSRRGRDAAA